ncbi:SURF1 family protein [Microbacterium xanthum]|uniref:SURF1 family protein n=1 Tax=Microbacterium xanthum TaxID=3079794 RepID=UPI002AD473C2|nr:MULTISPECIES: SURF1 family cytochrome oxidase biogenesis protein [unclassified Microbacterium]MDZ8170882.1 SURF1 family cytochrome oxidase biogenesis protein [Microbacterium sp. KSW-48]MDZ8201394.1 SURF1 family cytochrome oxidase biogenesis protein [Microbacterium sp. SSW1-59]
MLRPQWLGVLGLCLVVAGVFAWLGQWQLARAIDMQPLPEGVTEQVQPIDEVVPPGEYLPEPLVGQRVTVTGEFVADDFVIVSSRFNDGVEGYWVTGQFRVATADEPTSVAVAVGWAATVEQALAAMDELAETAATRAPDAAALAITGRLISDEGPVPPPQSADPSTLTRMSPAALLSRWSDVEDLDVYRPYLVSETASGPLEDITTRPPDQGAGVNWLNVFYAAEWAIFAGFAFYMWYRLARDAWEKEVEDIEDAAADGSRGSAAQA